MEMDDDSTSMTMTFTSFMTYKTKILFTSWNVQTKWEFALSWIAVAFAVVAYHAMRYLIFMLEDYMDDSDKAVSTARRSTSGSGGTASRAGSYGTVSGGEPEENENDNNCCAEDISSVKGNAQLINNSNDDVMDTAAMRYFSLRILHSVLAGLNYGLALILMLVAMTYNPSLLVALMVGYAVGDFIFFAKMRRSTSLDCHS